MEVTLEGNPETSMNIYINIRTLRLLNADKITIQK